MRTLVVRLAAGTTRAQVRAACSRIHDVPGVVTVEVADDRRSIRVFGYVERGDVAAAVAPVGLRLA